MEVCAEHSLEERCRSAPATESDRGGSRAIKKQKRETPSEKLLRRLSAAAKAKALDRPVGYKEIVLGATWYGETYHAAAAAALQLYAGASLRVFIRVHEDSKQEIARATRQAHFIRASGCEGVEIITPRDWRHRADAYEKQPWFDAGRGERSDYNLSAGMGVATYIIEQATWNLAAHDVDVHEYLRHVWLGSMSSASRDEVERYFNMALASQGRRDEPQKSEAVLDVGLGESSLDKVAYPRCLVVSRHNENKPYQNTNDLTLRQICDALWRGGIVPVHIGSRVPSFAYRDPSDEDNETNVFVEHFRADGFGAQDSYQRDLYLYYLLWTRYGVCAQVGPKSGAIDGPAMMGLPTLYFEHRADPRHDRLAKLVGAFEPRYRFLRTAEFLAHARDQRDDSDLRGQMGVGELERMVKEVRGWLSLSGPSAPREPPPPPDPNWRVHPVPGDGDCFFHVVGRCVGQETAQVRRRMAHWMAQQLFAPPYDDIVTLTGAVLSGAVTDLPVNGTAIATEIGRRYARTLREHGPPYPKALALYVAHVQFTRAEVEGMASWQQPPPQRPQVVLWGDEDTALYVAAQVYACAARLYAHLADVDGGSRLAIIAEFPGNDDSDGIDVYYNHLHFDAIEFFVDRAVYRA